MAEADHSTSNGRSKGPTVQLGLTITGGMGVGGVEGGRKMREDIMRGGMIGRKSATNEGIGPIELPLFRVGQPLWFNGRLYHCNRITCVD